MIGHKDIFIDRAELNTFSLQINHCGIQGCTPGYSYSFPANAYHLIHFVLRGSGFVEVHKRLTNVQAGQAFYIPSGTPAKYYASLTNPWTYGWVGFYSNTANPFITLLFKENNVINAKMPMKEIEKNLLSIISVTDKRFSDYLQYDESVFPGRQFTSITNLADSLKANSRMLSFFSDFINSQSCENTANYEKNSPALRAKAFMDAHYSEPIKMHDVAAFLNIHPNYLCSAFKKIYGQTPSEYLRAIRMAQAAMLLCLTDYSVSIIAESLGYANPFQFSTVFKSYYGLSPTAYRKKG